MRRIPLLALALSAVGAPADAQFTSARPSPTDLRPQPAPGGFLGGADDCSLPHTHLGVGTRLGVPFTTGTTGSEGQNETTCSGLLGVHHDVWFDWTANEDGEASLTFPSYPGFTARITVWPGNVGCPVAGTSIACNSFFSTSPQLVWPTTAGATYTLQVGARPGSGGGSGTFDLVQVEPAGCGTYDDGSSENALGLIAGGETGWLHEYDCLLQIDSVSTAFGYSGGAPPPGYSLRLAIYEDSDCDGSPLTGPLQLLWSLSTFVPGTFDIDEFFAFDTGGVAIPSGCSFVLASAEHAPGLFPAAMDQSNPTPRAWVVGASPTGSTLDLADLTNNNVPPLQTTAIGFPTAWLLRAEGLDRNLCRRLCEECRAAPGGWTCGGCPVCPVVRKLCVGDGIDAACPCGNDADADEHGGCLNSSHPSRGAELEATGSPSITNDSLALVCFGAAPQPGLFLQGEITLHPGSAFGDGLRCAGQNVLRLVTVVPTAGASGATCASTLGVSGGGCGTHVGGFGGPLASHPGNAALAAGDTRFYQHWYRDPSGPCGSGFNLSNGIEVRWGP